MGNLHPLRTLLEGTVEEVKEAACDCIKKAGYKGGYILCTGGGLAPGTPRSNVRAMVEAPQNNT